MTTATTSRRRLAGFECCTHICTACTSPSTGINLWKREGHSARRHSASEAKHPNCHPTCPGWSAVEGHTAHAVRVATKEDMLAYQGRLALMEADRLTFNRGAVENDEGEIDRMEEDEPEPMDVDIDQPGQSIDHASSTGSSSTMGTSTGTSSTEITLPDPMERPLYHQVGPMFETLSILFIPDPTRYTSSSRAKDDLSWGTVIVTEEEAEAISELRGTAWHVRSKLRGGNTKVDMQEWLFIVIAMSRIMSRITGPGGQKAFHVHYMLYDQFLMALMDHSSNATVWSTITHVDCIIGGADLSIDYVSIEYNITSKNEKDYRRALRDLSRRVIIWPHPEHVDRVGAKSNLIASLDEIARDVTFTPRPVTKVIKRPCPIPTDTVLKRTHSDSGNHVVLPNAIGRTWDKLQDGPRGSIWLSQTYIPTLRQLGEFRVMLVNGEPLYTVFTVFLRSDCWDPVLVDRFLALSEISEIHARGALTTKDLINPDSGTKKERDLAYTEFHGFVRETFSALASREAREVGGRTSISLFCRMDIGIMFDNQGTASYFVNEVERTPTTSLWTRNAVVPINILANTFAWALHRWLMTMKNPYNNPA